MKACSIASVLASTVAFSILVFTGCGGGQSESPPPASAAEEPASNAEPGPAAATSEPVAPAPADSAAGERTPPADLGEGDARTTEVIAGVVKAHRKEARECYEKALKQLSGLKGDVVIHFTLSPSGKVKLAELNHERSTIHEPSVATCVIGVIQGIEFPKSSKGLETTINYPFNFNP